MDDITAQEYEKVLKYMETANQQNFQHAVQIMKRNEFNLEIAINQKFQNNINNQQSAEQRLPPNPHDDEQVVRKYVLHLQKKENEWNLVKVIFDIIKRILLFFLNLILNLIPYSIKIKIFGNQFQKLYFNKLANNYEHKSLSYHLNNTKNINSKTVLLIVSPKQVNTDIITFLNNQQISKKLKTNFYLVCYVIDHVDLKKIQNIGQSPLMIALRMNIFDEIVEVNRSRFLNQVNTNTLNRWAHDGRNLFKRDCNVLIKYRNYISRFYGNYYEYQQQQEEVNLIQREKDTIQIRQQNDLYKEIERKAQEKNKMNQENLKKMHEEMKLKQQIQEQRKIRKMSIPDQPTEGHIIRISFRCPNGTTIFRNFEANQKLELIYNWVELNEEIEFEDESRKFEIMYSFPPEPLSDRKQKSLKQIFQSSQQKVVIRQL